MVEPVLTQNTFFYWTDEVRTCTRKQRRAEAQSTDATYLRQSMMPSSVRNADGGRETTPATSTTSRHCGKHATVQGNNVQWYCALSTGYCIAAENRKEDCFGRLHWGNSSWDWQHCRTHGNWLLKWGGGSIGRNVFDYPWRFGAIIE